MTFYYVQDVHKNQLVTIREKASVVSVNGAGAEPPKKILQL